MRVEDRDENWLREDGFENPPLDPSKIRDKDREELNNLKAKAREYVKAFERSNWSVLRVVTKWDDRRRHQIKVLSVEFLHEPTDSWILCNISSKFHGGAGGNVTVHVEESPNGSESFEGLSMRPRELAEKLTNFVQGKIDRVASMNDLKDRLIRLGSENPELRKHLRPVLDRIAGNEGFAFDSRSDAERAIEILRRDFDIRGQLEEIDMSEKDLKMVGIDSSAKWEVEFSVHSFDLFKSIEQRLIEEGLI
jgi:hypothetical protein